MIWIAFTVVVVVFATSFFLGTLFGQHRARCPKHADCTILYAPRCSVVLKGVQRRCELEEGHKPPHKVFVEEIGLYGQEVWFQDGDRAKVEHL